MSLSVGIVGLPNTGKSTLFNALTKKSVPAENFPFCTIDPSVGIVSVPDERLEVLSKISSSENIITTVVEFVDIAGLVKGASKGEGLGNAFLSHIREVDAILLMVRCFNDENIIHVENAINPVSDAEIIETELMLSDIQILENRIQKMTKELKKGGSEAKRDKILIDSALSDLYSGVVPNLNSEEDRGRLAKLGLLTVKPKIYVANTGSNPNEEALASIKEYAKKNGTFSVTVHALLERDLSELSEEEVEEMKGVLSLENSGLDELIKASYELLDLITFFTSGEKETRAWTTKKGSTAPKAGSSIHSDFETKFIRAEVVSYADIVSSGSFSNARDRGMLKIEGKDYIVQDGDVLFFRI